MRVFFQDFILNQFVVAIALIAVLGFITRWAVVEKKEYPGYGLGWLISILFLIIYTILFSDRLRLSGRVDLSLFQILLSIVLGLASGAAVQYAQRISRKQQGIAKKRSIALQVALYTTIGLVLLGLVIIESSMVQRMIGIYGLALGIAMLLGMVWSNIDDDQSGQDASSQAAPNNRYDNTRPNFKNRNR